MKRKFFTFLMAFLATVGNAVWGQGTINLSDPQSATGITGISVDESNKVITINSFNILETNDNVNIGFFGEVSENTILKNIIVALPANNEIATPLNNYSQINYGGLAAINNGIITNCDVITLGSDTNYSYTLNFNTTNSTSVFIGGLVGQNTGIITNSRVGRDSVEVLRTDTAESTIVRSENLSNVASRTIINVSGPGQVAGFVAQNSGTISSSFVKNIQIEVF